MQEGWALVEAKTPHRSKVNSSILKGMKKKNMHPEAHGWADVVVAAYRNSLPIASIFSVITGE